MMEPFRPLPWAPTPNYPALPMPLFSWRIVDPCAPCAPPVMAAAGDCTPIQKRTLQDGRSRTRYRLTGKCIALASVGLRTWPLIPSSQRITFVAVSTPRADPGCSPSSKPRSGLAPYAPASRCLASTSGNRSRTRVLCQRITRGPGDDRSFTGAAHRSIHCSARWFAGGGAVAAVTPAPSIAPSLRTFRGAFCSVAFCGVCILHRAFCQGVCQCMGGNHC